MQMDTTRSRRDGTAIASRRRILAAATSLLVPLMTLTSSLAVAQSASPSPLAESSPTPAAPGLGGSAWHVLNIGPTPAHLQLDQTIEFGADGTLTVTTGCATYAGTYRAAEGELMIDIQQVPGSTIECSYSDQGLADLYRNILGSVASWSIDEDGYLTFEPNADYAGWNVGLEPVSVEVPVGATSVPSPGSE